VDKIGAGRRFDDEAPAATELMGTANWWAPSWLVRRLPTIRVDTVEEPVPARR
jgi:hypothetical protein